MAPEEKKKKTAGDDDEDYDSEEDADFQDDAMSNSSSDEPDAPPRRRATEKDLDSGDEATINKRKKKRKETEDNDDIILTRAQKKSKAEEVIKAKEKAPVEQDKPEDLDALWEKLNQTKPAIQTTVPLPSTTPSSTEETIKIKRTYEFAGQTITEEKQVLKNSAEAKAYLASIHTPLPSTAPAQSGKPPTKRPVKRKSNLEEMARGGKPAKLNVLEKSRLDWAGFVDKEGINDDLKRFNKDGYVERQEFLKRTR